MTRSFLLPLLRFGLVGGFVTAVVYVVFIALLKLGMHYLPASACGWAVGVGLNYVLSRLFTFAVKERAHAREFMAFAVGALLQLALGLACYALLMGRLKLGATPAFLINLVVTASFSFLFMRQVVFRRAVAALARDA